MNKRKQPNNLKIFQFIVLSSIFIFLSSCSLEEVHESVEGEAIETFSTTFDYKTQYDFVSDMLLANDKSFFVVGYASEESYDSETMVYRMDEKAAPITNDFPKKVFGVPFYFERSVIRKATQGSDGAYYVCGKLSDSRGQFSGYDECGFYAKLDQNGRFTIFEMDTLVNDPRSSFTDFIDLALTQDGHLTIIGNHHTGNVDEQLQVIKVNTSTGEVITGYPKLLPTPKAEGYGYPLGFKEMSDGSLVVYGRVGSDTFNGFVWKLNSDGTPVDNGVILPNIDLWNYQVPSDIVELDNGNYGLIGNYNYNTFSGTGDVFFWEFDQQLNPVESIPHLYGSTVAGKFNFANTAVVSSNGNIYIAGRSNFNGADSAGSLIIIDQEGNEIIDNSPRIYDLSMDDYENITAIVEAPDGGFMLAGYNSIDMFFIKVNKSGELME